MIPNEVSIALLIILALINASASSLFSSNAQNLYATDKKRFLHKLFVAEGWYRSVAVNLSFAGIALALTSAPLQRNPWLINAILNPVLLVFVNLIAGCLAAIMLHDDLESPGGVRGWIRTAVPVMICCTVFIVTVVSFVGGKSKVPAG
jgi:hypothetical protein